MQMQGRLEDSHCFPFPHVCLRRLALLSHGSPLELWDRDPSCDQRASCRRMYDACVSEIMVDLRGALGIPSR